MVNSAQGRRRTIYSLRRRIILKKSLPDFDARRALIVRWIGAAARRRAKTVRQDVQPVPAFDNVTTLTWAQTCGRRTRRSLGDGHFPAAALAMRSV